MYELTRWFTKWEETHGEPMRLCVDPENLDLWRWEHGVYVNLTPTPQTWHHCIAGETGEFIRPARAQELHWHAGATKARRLDGYERHDLNGAEPWINLASGVVDLRTGQHRPHGEEWLTTHQVPHEYIEDEVQVQRETKALHDWMTLAMGAETAEVMWTLFGYALVGGNPGQLLVILQGPGGSGKGTLSNVLRTLLGEGGYSSLSLGKVGGRFTSHLLHRTPVNICGDVVGGVVPRYGDLLALTGGDPVHADRKGRDGFEFRWDGLLVMATNDTLSLPKGASSRTGWWRRALYIDVEHPPVPLGERLNSRAMLDRIMPNPSAAASRAVRAISEAVQKDAGALVQPSTAMQQAAARARLTGDVVADWAMVRLEQAHGQQVEASDAWADFQVWAIHNGITYPHGSRRFYGDLETVVQREGLGHRDDTRTATSRCRFVGVQLGGPQLQILRSMS